MCQQLDFTSLARKKISPSFEVGSVCQTMRKKIAQIIDYQLFALMGG